MDSESSSYDALVRPVQDQMLRSIWRITRSAEDAEDALQESLTIIWKRRARIGRHPRPRALILRICVNCACDVLRARLRRGSRETALIDSDLLHAKDGPVGEQLHRQEMQDDISLALLRLSSRQATWYPAESSAWAEVVKAVTKKPWLHAVYTVPKDGPTPGTKGEMWFSAHRAIEAFKFREIGWIDIDQKTVDLYHPSENSIVRMEDVDWGSFEPHEAIFRAFLSADVGRTIGTGRHRLVHQQERCVTESGNRWIEHRFQYQPMDGTATVESEMVVYVDPDTQLPFRFDQVTNVKDSDSPKVNTFRIDIDYPDAGPEDIYALEVPKTAKILDPVKADVKQLVTEVHSTRWQSERYNALIVESLEREHWSQAYGVYRMRRSGSRWKIERSWGYTTLPTDKLASENANPATWWREHAAKVRFVPYKLCDGSVLWEYTYKKRAPTEADIAAGEPADAMVLVSQEKQQSRCTGQWDIDDYSSKGRPYFPIHGAALYEATVDPMPKSGPLNTVLLEFHDSSWKPGKPFPPQIWRYWIDPERSYLVMREEQIITVDGKETIANSFAIEGATQDPNGQWYPTCMRVLNGCRSGSSGTTVDYFLRFYYDFTTPIPDSVFKAD